MRRADRHVLLRTLLVAIVLLSGIGIWRWIVASNRSRDAEALLAVLPDAQIAQIPGMIDDVRRSTTLAPYLARHLDRRLQKPDRQDWERVVLQLARLAVAPTRSN